MTRRTDTRHGWLPGALIVLIALATVSRGEAGELGHYAPGLLNVRDTILPPKGLYGAVYGYYYTTDDFRDASGDNHDQIHAVGAQLGYAVPHWRLSAVAKYLYQYYAEDRFRGQEFTLTVGYQFF